MWTGLKNIHRAVPRVSYVDISVNEFNDEQGGSENSISREEKGT
jgi:hypothetical protein